MGSDEGGGFLLGASESSSVIASHGLLSPAASSRTADSISSGSVLPSPRHVPLKAGSAKESAFINYLDARIRRIQRRYGLRVVNAPDHEREVLRQRGDRSGSSHGLGSDDHTAESSVDSRLKGAGHAMELNHASRQENGNSGAPGYTSFAQAASEISRLVSVLWVSGTPSLQIPYLLSLALLVVTYVPAFPAAPRSMFSVLRKLDYAFASLVQGRDLDSGQVLPGFWGGNAGRGIPSIDETTKVRIRSLVERTRVVVVDVMSRSDNFATEEENDSLDGTTDEEMNDTDVENFVNDERNDYGMNDDWDMDIARVYDRTIVELGGTFGLDDETTITNE